MRILHSVIAGTLLFAAAVQAGTGTVTNCSCSDCHAQTTFETDKCFHLDNVGAYYNANKRIVTCDTQPSMCAHLVMYSDDSQRSCDDSKFWDFGVVICGECQRYNHLDKSTNVTTVKFRKTACDEATDEVWYDEDCDSSCSTCQKLHKGAHSYLNCSAGLFGDSYSAYNQGLFPCATVTESIYPVGDSYCNGTAGPNVVFKTPQYSCSFGLQWQCDNPPALPAPKTDKINIQTCKGTACTDCTSVTIYSGDCLNGERYTCGEELATCAHLILHNSSTGCNNFEGLYNVPCGGCSKWSPKSDYWVKTLCNMASGDVTYEGHCNSDCSVCNTSDLIPRPQFTCEKVTYADDRYVYNRGLFPCYTATKEAKFPVPAQCGGNASVSIQEAQGSCEHDHVYQCQLSKEWTQVITNSTFIPETPAPINKNRKHHELVAVTVGVILASLVLIAGIVFAYQRRKAHKVQQDMTELEEKLYNDQ